MGEDGWKPITEPIALPPEGDEVCWIEDGGKYKVVTMEGESLTDKMARSMKSLVDGKCGCWTCVESRGDMRCRMIVCPDCGNKRCPRASDHLLACTQSNEPGQPGSIY